jgi:hypothetical protein
MRTPKVKTKTTRTRIGKLQFESGYPNRETVGKLYDEMDFQRASQAYLWGLPIVGLAEWKHANDHVFKVRNGQLVSYITFDEKLGILTPNYTTPYLCATADLERSGPRYWRCPRASRPGWSWTSGSGS